MNTQTKQAKHTQWQINRAMARDGSALWANVYVVDTHEIVCHLDGDNKLEKAKRIIKAVNSHEELLGALQPMMLWLQAELDKGYPKDSMAALAVPNMLNLARNAIAHTTGE